MGEALDDDPAKSEQPEAQAESETKQSKRTAESSQSTESSQDSIDSIEEDPLKTPAFDPGSELNHTIYVRPTTWSELGDTVDIEIIPELKRQGVDDITKRELYDAALRFAASNPQKVAEEFIAARDPEEDGI